MYYTTIIETILDASNSLTIEDGNLEFLIDSSRQVISIEQLPDTKLSKIHYKMLASYSDFDCDFDICLNEISKRRCKKLTKRYGYIRKFSSVQLPYMESIFTEITIIGKINKRVIAPNRGSSCLLLQTKDQNLDISKLNILLSALSGIKLIITNIDGIIPSGDIAFVIVTDKYMDKLSFKDLVNIEVSVNSYSPYYSLAGYNCIMEDVDIKNIINVMRKNS